MAMSDNSDFIMKKDGKAVEERSSLASSNYQTNVMKSKEEEEMNAFEKHLSNHRTHTSALNIVTTQMST